MGDRGNVIVLMDDHPPVYLYTHWGGYDLPERVRQALRREERWDDAPYLARIVFDAMTGGHRGPTGFGIATFPCDNEHDYLLLDTEAHEVRVLDFRSNRNYEADPLTLPVRAHIPFAAFRSDDNPLTAVFDGGPGDD